MKNITNHIIVERGFLWISSFILCMACVKNEMPAPVPEPESGNFFTFSTTQSAKLSVDYQYPYKYRSYIEAYLENPLEKDEYGNLLVKTDNEEPFAKGYTDNNGKISLPVELPAAASKIYVYSPSLGAPTLTVYDMNGNPAETKISPARPVTKATQPYYANWTKQQLSFLNVPEWTYDKNGRPYYLLDSRMDMTQHTLETIQATIPQKELLDLRFASLMAVHISEKARVNLYNIFNKTPRNNALAYYVYSGDINNFPSQATINKNLILVYPNLSDDVLTAGDGVRLKYFDGNQWSDVFPANSNIGFVLLTDAWKDGQVNTNTNVMYSQKTYNRYSIKGGSQMANRPQMAAFKCGNDLILSFEDQPWTEHPHSPYIGDFSDNTFIIHADPVTSLPDVPDGKEPGSLDGIAIRHYGTLAFEDIWPHQGDYDMNDVVIGYDINDYFNMSQLAYTGFEGTFTFLHHGAQYKNGFGFQLETNRDNASVTITSPYSCNGQGIDSGLEKATIMLFDQGRNIPGGTTFKVKVIYKTPVPSPGYRTAPYNPFITIEKFLESDRKEVHLVNYPPTEKIDKTLLHYGKDLSDPSKGIYFVSDASYPFAINLTSVDNFIFPDESKRIDKVYPDFNKWYLTGGEQYKDWYNHPQPQ